MAPIIMFPTNVLPTMMAEKVDYVSSKTITPHDLPAMSALAVMSAAVQYLINFEREDGGTSPVSLNLIGLADSGERKTSVMAQFMEPIRDFERVAKERTAEALRKYRLDEKIFDAERRGLLAEIAKRTKEGDPIDDLRAALKRKEKNRPVKPLEPRLHFQDFTPNALVESMGQCWPSAILMSDEASGVFLGRSFGDMSVLNTLWGGDSTVRTRATGHFTLKWPPRLTSLLMLQTGEFGRFMRKRGTIAHDIGFLARALISLPPTVMGQRYVGVQKRHLAAPTSFDARVRELLEQSFTKIQAGDFTQATMVLSPDARLDWVQFFNNVESRINLGGDLNSMKDFASKIGENAIRIGAILEFFSTGKREISLEAMRAGIAVANYFLMHHQQIFDQTPVMPKFDADILYEAIANRVRKTGVHSWPRSYLVHRLPVGLRQNGRGVRALNELIAHGVLLSYWSPEIKSSVITLNVNAMSQPAAPAPWINQALLAPSNGLAHYG